jgi:hypothetical protein
MVLTLFIEGDREIEARAGAFVHVPRGVAHGFRAKTPVKMLALGERSPFELALSASIAAKRGLGDARPGRPARGPLGLPRKPPGCRAEAHLPPPAHRVRSDSA